MALGKPLGIEVNPEFVGLAERTQWMTDCPPNIHGVRLDSVCDGKRCDWVSAVVSGLLNYWVRGSKKLYTIG